MIEWIQANPVLFSTLIWPIVTGIISTIYQQLRDYPKTHAIFSAMVAAGLDLPAILAALKRLVTGSQPPPPASQEVPK